MKKIYLVITASFIAVSLQAQLVLTRAAYDHVIGELELSQGWHSTAPIPTNTGQNQLWDFSSISSPGPVDTTSFIAPAAIPSSSLFPTANIVATYDHGYKHDFYSSGNTQLNYLGYEDTGDITKFTDPQIQMLWPVSYGYSQSDTYGGPIAGGAYGTETGTCTTSATGTGTVIMPGGQQYNNVLQLTIYNVEVDVNGAVAFTFAGNTNYYFRAGEKSPFLAAGTYTTIDSPTSSQTVSGVYTYTTVPAQTVTGLKNNTSDVSFNVFPNPAKNTITVVFSNAGGETCVLQVCNAPGDVLKKSDPGKEAVLNACIDISDLVPGIYFLKVTQGDKSSVKKFAVE